MNENEIKQTQPGSKENRNQAVNMQTGAAVMHINAEDMTIEEITKQMAQLKKALEKKEAKREKALEQIVLLCKEHGITGKDVESKLGSGK